MRQAVTNVAWYSDEDDYVSFDEEDLNTGIQELYDDRSASDAGSDISDDEYYNSNKASVKSKSKSKPKIQKKRKKRKKNKKGKKKARAVQKNEEEQNQDDAVVNKPIQKKSSIFGDLFSSFLGGSNNNNKSDANVEQRQQSKSTMISKAAKPNVRARSISISYSESDEDNTENESSSSSSSSHSLPNRKGRSKISKRIHKLSEMKKQKQKKQAMGKRKVIHKQKVNAKVISIELGTLKESAQNIATGDPIRCKNQKCGAILSKYDELLKKYDDIKLDDDDESIWICSFCNHLNIIDIDNEEIPNHETIDYILEPPEENKQNDSNDNQEQQQQIIFCIDISGSMCVSQPVQGKKINLKGDRLKKQHDELAEFVDPMNRNQWMPNQSQNVTYISRLQSVQAAVDEQIEKLKITNPTMKVGLVTFNNEVTVYGDAMKDEQNGFEIITGDKLNDVEKLKAIGMSDTCQIRHNIKDSHPCLSNELWKLEETGQTALGPALVSSIAMASIHAGSQVILCTDGLANIGCGKIDDDNISGEFYENLGQFALEKGVCVSIISITDHGCKLEDLGKIVEITGGNLRRINPVKLTDKFAGIIEQEIIATLTNAKMLIHPALKFVDTAHQLKHINPFDCDRQANNHKKMSVIEEQKAKDSQVNEDDNKRKIYAVETSQQDIGNVLEDTTIFFEYEVRKDKIDEFKQLKHVPFQVHILYNKHNGSKMLRVITQQKEVTMDSKKVRENLDFKILSQYSTRVTTKLCGVGDYEASRAWTQANVRYMHKNVHNDSDLLTVASHVNSNVALDYQMGQQQMNEKISIVEKKKKDGWSWRNLMGQKKEDNNEDCEDENECSDDMAPDVNTNTWSWRGSNNQKYRSTQRNDKFSSLTYGMKKKY